MSNTDLQEGAASASFKKKCALIPACYNQNCSCEIKENVGGVGYLCHLRLFGSDLKSELIITDRKGATYA
jgi:hypothetical protein